MNKNIHVLCPNCGTEMQIPENSNLNVMTNGAPAEGTYYLIPKQVEKNGQTYDLSEMVKAMTGICCDKDVKVSTKEDKVSNKNASVCNNNAVDESISAIKESIYNDGDVKVNHLFRRWICAMTLKALPNYNRRYISGSSYKYQWETLKTELKMLAAMERDKDEELKERERFYNRRVIREMFEDYKQQLHTILLERNDFAKRNIKVNDDTKSGDKIIAIRLPWTSISRMAKYRGFKDSEISGYIAVSTIGSDCNNCCYNYQSEKDQKIEMLAIDKETVIFTVTGYYKIMSEYINRILMHLDNNTYAEILSVVNDFMEIAPLRLKKMNKANAWKNAFKGTGAYYTMQNLIRYQGYYLIDEATGARMYGEQAINVLDRLTDAYRDEYYRLFAVLKSMIKYNNKPVMAELIKKLA